MHYRPRPIDAPKLERDFRERTLDVETLDLPAFTRIALQISPEIEVVRARVKVAEAQITAAGARVNPSIASDGGYNTNPEAAALFSAALSFTIETGGKRTHRIAVAASRYRAAQLALAETEWQAHSRVRAAFVDHMLARRRLELLEREVNIRSDIVAIFDKRLAVGEAARPELDAFRVELIMTQAALKTAEGEVARSFVALALAAGLPSKAIEGRKIESASLETPPEESKLPLLAVQKAGLLHRIDVRRLLAEYDAADATLRLEIARQYPDIQIGPAYTLEESYPRYTFAGGLAPLPLFHRNQGAIATAEAARREVEARIGAAQAQALGDIDRALAQYRAALAEWKEAGERLESVQRTREAAAVRALEAGEGDRLGVATARLQSVTAQRARLEALARAQTALGALEDAVQQPLEPERGKP